MTAPSDSRHRLRLALLVVAMLLVAFVLLVATVIFSSRRENQALDAKLKNPANFHAARDLVMLCQTDPNLIRQCNGNADPYQIPSIAALRPDAGGGCVQSDGATIIWSNSWGQHFWLLRLLPNQKADAATRTWELSFSETDGSDDHVLMKFDVPTNARFTAADLGANRGH